MPSVENIVKKTDYCTEKNELLREQYKNLPVINGILEAFGDQAQAIEDALFQIRALNADFGVDESFPRESLERTAKMFGIVFPGLLSNIDLVYEIRAAIVIMFSRCRIEDIRRLPQYIYGAKSDIIETGDGIYLAIFGTFTQNNVELIFKSTRKLMPAGTRLHGIIQNNDGWFGLEGFSNSGTWRLSTNMANAANRAAQLIMDSEGNYLLT